ncbi:hypothetical protein SUGI_0109220 [Cryptomeria japonica]|uniref:lysM domain-containing GPI-anchored protein 1 n=1 Tax=Cryptomeria japonica TaxID=3369 RepID=UPI002408BBEA|nr:lysM domain-containing GPI-anchored protein 1 [Cryptomeria japonica]GLJ09419.1 hypothetical protein SUGI_0109220 [Cryptomeria japonica]
MEVLLICLLILCPVLIQGKSTIEPCSISGPCSALVGYVLPTDLKVSELATRFQVDPFSLLGANGFDPYASGAQTQILPAKSMVKVPIKCSCVDGIRKSVSTMYQANQVDTLQSIAESVFGGLVTWDQLKDANKIADTGIIDVGQSLVIPLPCTCFNGTDDGLPAVYMSYVVRNGDSLISIGKAFGTTVTDLMGVNSLQSSLITAGDILAVPLSACSSSNLNLSSDSDLLVANGSYALTANRCVQCNCGPNEMNLHCVESTLGTSCPSMQCNDSNLLIGDAIEQQTSAGCNVTACLYGGYLNGTIVTNLTNFLQPQCLGKYLGPVYTKPPTSPATTTQNSTIPESPSSAMSPSSHTIGVVKSNPASQPLGSSCPANEPLRWLSLLSIWITGLPYLIHVCAR